jgi:hypothetical protein
MSRPLNFLAPFALLILASCSALDSAVPQSATITCHTAYRSSVSVPIEREQTLTFGVGDDADSVAFTDLTFLAQYSSGEMNRERALRLWVTATGETAEITSQLYQLPLDSGPQNQFIGGHGFTGLNYVYHPRTGAELQFWCTAGAG